MLFLILLMSMSCMMPLTPHYSVVVDIGYSGISGARVNKIPTYKAIGQALASVPKTNSKPFTIFIKDGRYYEKLSVDCAHVRFIGESREGTILTYDACADSPDPQGGTLGTWGSYALRVTAPDFCAENLTIENGFDYPANADRSEDDPARVNDPQAVALMTSAGSDRTVFHNCDIRGYQDTLFANHGRHYFHQCHIYGHVDFIFGAGQAVFNDCDIISRDRKGKNPTGYISAPSTRAELPYGFLFIDCRLMKESPYLAPGSVCLGRPWHPNADARVNGCAVFIRCFMDDHIGPEGYARISARDSTGQRIWFEVEPDSRFFEYGSHGPGAINGTARPTLSEEAASWYIPEHVLNGWKP